MTPFELTLSITMLANSIANTLSDDELSIAASAFAQLSDTLVTIGLTRATCKSETDCPGQSDQPPEHL